MLALNGVHQTAKLAQDGKYTVARHNLHSIQRLLGRIARSDVQLEEYANFVSTCEDLETILQNLEQRGGKGDDKTTKVLHSMKTTSKSIFLSGIRKKDIVAKRKNHTKSKLAKNVPKIQQDSDSDEEDQPKINNKEEKKDDVPKQDDEVEKKVCGAFWKWA